MAARKQELIYMTTDERLTVVETTLSNIGVTLLDIRHDMKRQFDALDKRMDKMDERFDRIDEKFDKIDEKFDKIDEKFEKMEEKFDKKFVRMEEKLDKIDEKFDRKIEDKFQILINRSWSSFLWLMSMMIGLAGLIAHAQHWI
ncbi:MAG: hypothetical protein K0S63_959 [Gammaproteobacteria bacterium]|nr:hypothetical protein [Gammaproteobacteria bacterium]